MMEQLKKSLADNNQDHLLRFYDELDNEQRQSYLEHLMKMDFDETSTLFKKATCGNLEEVELLDSRMKPIPDEQFESATTCSEENLKQYYERGLEEISKGHVAVILMAGGQGTRLGVNYPKGMYNVGLQSNKSLFQIQAERIQKIQQLASEKYNGTGKLTWFIMTSGPTIKQTKEYLKQNNYFGLNEQDVIIFEQGLLPCFDLSGKIFLGAKDKLALAPDGNGGIYKALKVNGILTEFNNRGIKYLHVHSVDNILIKVADPTFIGYCVSKNADCGAKVVEKSSPSEAVGVVCLVDNKFQVVEYSEITAATSELKNENGLIFKSGNICNHFFTTEFLECVAEKEMKLHVAKKKIPHINENGEFIKPTVANGIKIEKFVFDVFEFSKNFITWEVPRETEFSALKNADDAKKDCPSTARNDIYKLHKSYLVEAGAVVLGNEIEISPIISYGGEGLEKYYGKVITSPCYIN